MTQGRPTSYVVHQHLEVYGYAANHLNPDSRQNPESMNYTMAVS
jgi:hypothetical protein